MNNDKITIKEIARLAGVSLGTVDRVIHNRPEVSESTRNQVLKIIEELGYKPNLIARTLASKKKTVICVFIPKPSKSNVYWSEPVEGVKRAEAEIAHFGVEVKQFSYNFLVEEEFKLAAQEILDLKPDGVVLASFFEYLTSEFTLQCDELSIPYVFIDSKLPQSNYLSFIGQDTYLSGMIAAKLIDRTLSEGACVLIANVTRNFDNTTSFSQRTEGFKTFFDNNSKGKKLTLLDISLTDADDPENITMGETILKTEKLEAIYVPNSRAFIIAEQLLKHNITHLKLVGHDLIEHNNQFLNTGLIEFLINQRPQEQGYKAVMTLFNFIVLGTVPPKEDLIPIDIVIKENLHCYL
jgi:LacI family transcriptional regulator